MTFPAGGIQWAKVEIVLERQVTAGGGQGGWLNTRLTLKPEGAERVQFEFSGIQYLIHEIESHLLIMNQATYILRNIHFSKSSNLNKKKKTFKGAHLVSLSVTRASFSFLWYHNVADTVTSLFVRDHTTVN